VDDAAPTPPDDDARRHLDRLASALAALDDETLRRALASLSETNRLDVATQLQVPRAAMHLGDALVPLARRKIRVAGPARQLSVAFSLTEPVNDVTIKELGPRHEDPSRDDLLEVLPGVVEQFGAPWVTLMVAAYAASDAPCQGVMAELLDSDERFAIGEPVALDDADEGGVTAANARDEEAQAAKRAQRKAAKDARRAEEARKQAARAHAEEKRREARRAAKRGRG